MNKFSILAKEHWEDGINFLIAILLAFSPWVLNFYGIDAAMATSLVIGVIIAVSSAAALIKFQEWEEWVNTLMGISLLIAPLAFGYYMMPAAAFTHVIFGLVVLAMSGYSIWHFRHTPKESQRSGMH